MNKTYEDELFVYKYRPSLLKDIDRPVADMFHKIIEKNTTPNIILYGLPGTGKKTLLYAYLSSKYGTFKTQCIQKEFKINTKTIELPIFYSKFHVEIDIRTFIYHARNILPILIKEFAQTKNVLSNQHKLFVIHHIEELEMQTQHTLRRILEMYIENCRFLFVCTKLNKITHPLQSRCMLIRVPAFTSLEITKVLTTINQQLDNKRTTEQLKTIVTECKDNIKTAVMLLEASYYDFEADVDYQKELTLLLHQIIDAKKITMSFYESIDEYLYKILYKNRCLQDLIQTTFGILRTILHNDYTQLNELLPYFLKYDQNIVNGTRDFMHLQGLFYYLVYYFHKNK